MLGKIQCQYTFHTSTIAFCCIILQEKFNDYIPVNGLIYLNIDLSINSNMIAKLEQF